MMPIIAVKSIKSFKQAFGRENIIWVCAPHGSSRKVKV